MTQVIGSTDERSDVLAAEAVAVGVENMYYAIEVAHGDKIAVTVGVKGGPNGGLMVKVESDSEREAIERAYRGIRAMMAEPEV